MKEQLFLQELQSMKTMLTTLQESNVGHSKKYQYEELCPYPFKRDMFLTPFPKKLITQNFLNIKARVIHVITSNNFAWLAKR